MYGRKEIVNFEKLLISIEKFKQKCEQSCINSKVCLTIQRFLLYIAWIIYIENILSAPIYYQHKNDKFNQSGAILLFFFFFFFFFFCCVTNVVANTVTDETGLAQTI